MKNLTAFLFLGFVSGVCLSADQQAAPRQLATASSPRVLETTAANPIKVQIVVSADEGREKGKAFLGVPDVVWSGVIGSLIAALSSGFILLISNKHNRDRQTNDLAHDACEKEKDRKLNLRKEVYSQLAGELTNGNAHLSNTALTNLDKELSTEPFLSLMSALSKVVLIAGPEAQSTANKLISCYGSVFFLALEWRMKFSVIQQKIDSDPASSGLPAQKVKLIGEFMDSLLLELAPLRKIQAKLLAELKAELGIHADLDALERQFEEMASEAASRSKAFHAKAVGSTNRSSEEPA